MGKCRQGRRAGVRFNFRFGRSLGVFLVALTLLPLLVSEAFATPQRSDRLLDRGKLALDRLDFDQAILLFQQSLTADPKNAPAYSYLGQSYQVIGELDLARKYFDLALSIDPDDRLALSESARLDMAERRFDEATARLARLERVCGDPCPEVERLERSIRSLRRAQSDQ